MIISTTPHYQPFEKSFTEHTIGDLIEKMGSMINFNCVSSVFLH
eukprot:UN11129